MSVVNFQHKSIMLKECMQGLDLKVDGIYFDGTLGGGGHSFEILKRTSPCGRLIATDIDEDAIVAATARLAEFQGRFKIYKSNYKDIASVLELEKVDKLDGILLDFGISSFQIDEMRRGFSYMKDAPLDMRMDQKQELSAYQVVNTYEQERLFKIIQEYGEEKYAYQIAKNIVKERQLRKIDSTFKLCNIIEKSMPPKDRKPAFARKTFQAIRIEVNQELEGLEEFVYTAVQALRSGGRICIMTFHSLEDRIVKNVFRKLEMSCICDKSIPICICGNQQKLIQIYKKPIVASSEECAINARAKSAKLRIGQRV